MHIDYTYLIRKREHFMEEHGKEREVETFIAPAETSSHHYPAFEVALVNMLSMEKEVNHSRLAMETFQKLYVATGLVDVTPFPMDIYVMHRNSSLTSFVPTGTENVFRLKDYCAQHGIAFEY